MTPGVAAFCSQAIESSSAGSYRSRFPLGAPGTCGALGVNIHFNDPASGEMEQLAAAGFRWVRQDFAWEAIEQKRGVYDFAPYDRLMARLKQHAIRPIFILDYGNALYQQGSPRSEAARQAFAQFAAAAVTHFRGQGVVWEMYNEPNIDFWKPVPNVEEYIALALATGKAIRAAAPDEWYVGPGVSGVDSTFIERCLKAGLLRYWDAVSFHPYRESAPETVAADIFALRSLVDRYAPPGKSVPLICSEWGYSERYSGLDLRLQSCYIARQALTNLANGLAVSIWYDWHDDGADPNEPEHHFGTVYNDYRPKSTYTAIKTLTATLAGSHFDKRLALPSENDYCLLFAGRKGPILAVWTTDGMPHTVRIPASPGRFEQIDALGQSGEVVADANGLTVTAADAPRFLRPMATNAALERALHWRALPANIGIDSPEQAVRLLSEVAQGSWTAAERAARIRVNLLTTAGSLIGQGGVATAPGRLLKIEQSPALSALPYRSDRAEPLLAAVTTPDGISIVQAARISGRHPLRIVPFPPIDRSVSVRIENPTGAAFDGQIVLESGAAAKTSPAAPLHFAAGETEKLVRMPLGRRADGETRLGFRIEQRSGAKAGRGVAPVPSSWLTVSREPVATFAPLESFAQFTKQAPLPEQSYRVLPDGDPAVSSRITATVTPAPAGYADPAAQALQIQYDFAPGWKFLRLAAVTREPLAGFPKALGVWVYGDASGDVLNARFVDVTGQTFQPTAGRIDWSGWRFVRFRMDGKESGHWGGSNDGVIQYPVYLDTLLLVDSPGKRGGKGRLYATGFTLIR